ncbi:MAG: hypothetical protein QM756_12270 [Polyangiaceae bacterium]
MKVLGFRFCTVSPEAPKLASFLDALGFERHPLEGGDNGAVFAAGESWLAMWPPSEEMQPGVMLQVVVDDADAFAERAREQGLNPVGPTDSKTKRLYFLQAPTGLQISIQSRLPGHAEHSVPAPPARPKVPAPPPAPARVRNIAVGPASPAAPPTQTNAPSAPPPPVRGHSPSAAPPPMGRPRVPTPPPPPPGTRRRS